MCAPPKCSPSRILFTVATMRLGGSEAVILNLLRHIDRGRFEPHLALLERVGERLPDVPPDIQVHDLGGRRARHAILALAMVCWKVRPQVVLSTSAYLNSAVIAAGLLLPTRTTLLTREGEDTNSHTSSRFRFFAYKHAYRRADLVICQSDHMKEDLVRHFGLAPSKVVRIYNPVDINCIAALAESEPDPFPEPGPNLVGIGRFSHEKGFDLLLRCMPLIRAAIPSVRLTLVGDGPDLPALRLTQRDLDLNSCVRFVGLRRNPYPFLKHADLLVLPSRSEGLPNVVLEAVALGTPVVASNCTGALNEISSCTRHMRIVNYRTPEALASEIISALSNTGAWPNAGLEPEFEARFGVRAVTAQYESRSGLRRVVECTRLVASERKTK